MSEIIRQLAKPIRAYHGSPHDFDRFDSKRIGTGEGAQAFGHGLYFAGNENVADTYRRSLGAMNATPEQYARELWRRFTEESGGDTSQGIGRALDWATDSRIEAQGIPDAEQRWAKIINHLVNIDSLNTKPPKRLGHMYEVEIAHPENTLLNYDKPFSDKIGARAAAVLREHNPAAISSGTLREIETGEWNRIIHNTEYGSPYQRAATGVGQMARTRGGAQALKDAGIPGVKYLDDGSRYGDGPVTRNYVIFPGAEDGIRILRKYGVMAPVAAGAATQQEQQK